MLAPQLDCGAKDSNRPYGWINTLSVPAWAARSKALIPSDNENSSSIKTVGSTSFDSINFNAGSNGPQREPMIFTSSTTMDEKSTLISPLYVDFNTSVPRGRIACLASAKPPGDPVASTTTSQRQRCTSSSAMIRIP